MKFNKLYMALGVAALALASCSEDEEYQPAKAVTTPPAYFNISDNKSVDLENNTTEISFPIYRAEAGAAFNPNLAISIVSGDGVSIADEPFTSLNENESIFAEGATTGAIKYAVDMSKIVPMNDYRFLIKVNDGEDTPYFITSAEFVVCYVPWESMADPATGALSTLVDNSMWQCLSGGLEMNLEVVVEKHPEKNLFRITHPYLNAPGAINSAVGETFAEYYLDPTDPHYLYLNAENANQVVFCDSQGDLIKSYEPGIRVIYNDTWKGYGDMYLLNMYWYFVNNEWYMVDDSQGISPESGEFSKCIGQFKDGKITFGEDAVWFGFDVDKTAVWSGKGWTLKLAGGSSIGWASLGEATFTDGFVAQYWGEANPTYKVAAMENTTSNGVYRLQNPYRNGTYPLADSSTDANGDGPWNIVIDCSDPNFVVIEPQATGFLVGTEQYIANAAGYYTTVDDATKRRSKEQIIADGLNDTYDAATGTITINHPMLSGDNGVNWANVWETTAFGPNTNFQPVVIVLPAADAQAASAQAKHIGNGKISLAKARTASHKIIRR